MIYTLTTNPAIDMNITSDTISTEHVNRTRDAVYTPNGKGLNVSFTLKHYGTDSKILGFFGGFSGDYIVREAARVCPVMPVQIDGITRGTGSKNYFLLFGSSHSPKPAQNNECTATCDASQCQPKYARFHVMRDE